MTTQRILVTGGAGYVGSHACKALALAGYEPIVYDNVSNGHEWAVKWGPLEVGDVGDRERLVAVFRHYKPIAVMHFAAFAYVGESIHKPLEYYTNNVVGSLTLLDAMNECGIEHIVFSSSCAVYGVPNADQIYESTPTFPINPYGESKLMVEQCLRSISKAKSLRYVALRYFNAAGADPDVEVGELHEPETHIIPLALQAAIKGKEAITVYGNHYPTADGTCIRDYVHVTDLAKGHLYALDYLLKSGESLVVNLGTGQGTSVLDILESIERVTGYKVPYRIGQPREGDPPKLVASNELAWQCLGWQHEHSTLDEIIGTAFAWEQHRR